MFSFYPGLSGFVQYLYWDVYRVMVYIALWVTERSLCHQDPMPQVPFETVSDAMVGKGTRASPYILGYDKSMLVPRRHGDCLAWVLVAGGC